MSPFLTLFELSLKPGTHVCRKYIYILCFRPGRNHSIAQVLMGYRDFRHIESRNAIPGPDRKQHCPSVNDLSITKYRVNDSFPITYLAFFLPTPSRRKTWPSSTLLPEYLNRKCFVTEEATLHGEGYSVSIPSSLRKYETMTVTEEFFFLI